MYPKVSCKRKLPPFSLKILHLGLSAKGSRNKEHTNRDVVKDAILDPAAAVVVEAVAVVIALAPALIS